MLKRDIVAAFDKLALQWQQDLIQYDKELLYAKPETGGWCLAELYDHVMRVTRHYQLPNYHKCLNAEGKQGVSKNIKGFAVFNLNVLPKVKIRMESFPDKQINDFTPELRERQDLTKDFAFFIEEVKKEAIHLKGANLSELNYHPFFGKLNAREWFALVEIHMRHHQPQKRKLENLVS